TCCVRSAQYRKSSASGVSGAASGPSRRRRIAAPAAVPPGSRVSITRRPPARRCSARGRRWGALPEPSLPSNVLDRPPGERAGPADHVATPEEDGAEDPDVVLVVVDDQDGRAHRRRLRSAAGEETRHDLTDRLGPAGLREVAIASRLAGALLVSPHGEGGERDGRDI